MATFISSQRIIVLLGDFNCVYLPEDTTKDVLIKDQSAEALSSTVEEFGLVDVGDVLRENRVQFTHFQGRSHARLDRAYVSAELVPSCNHYGIKHVSFSDHSLVVFTIGSKVKASRFNWQLWKLNEKLLQDERFVNETAKVNLKGIDEGNVPDSVPPPAKVQVTQAGAEATGASSEITPPPTKVADEPVSLSDDMDVTSDAKGAGKRLRDEVEDHSRDTDGVDTEGPTPKTPTVRRSTLKKAVVSSALADSAPAQREPQHDGDDKATDAAKATVETLGSAETPDLDVMETSQVAAGLTAGKRPHEEDGVKQQPAGEGDEPPPKAPGVRLSTLKPRPNIPVDERQAGKPPPATTSNTVAAAVEVQREVQPESEGKLEDTTTVSAKTPDNVEPRNPETMNFSQEAAALTAGKRSHEEFVGKKPEPGGGSDEPPPKTQEFGALL
ncbi:hypothetical protein HPB49_008058 [Dermacentor silvarum]|uniref:Uncharacterized protein n=1 Tax=Dermacentor silvarum TaxID=543639 RepID=A0ACB8DXL4_DERSI|nr:hypothetical protein HPB49_008058 [Dermacentor silvarum]